MVGSAASLRRRYTERIRNGSRTADPVIRDEVLADVRRLIHLIGELGDVRCDEDLDFNSETLLLQIGAVAFRELGCALEAYEMGLRPGTRWCGRALSTIHRWCVPVAPVDRSFTHPLPYHWHR